MWRASRAVSSVNLWRYDHRCLSYLCWKWRFKRRVPSTVFTFFKSHESVFFPTKIRQAVFFVFRKSGPIRRSNLGWVAMTKFGPNFRSSRMLRCKRPAWDIPETCRLAKKYRRTPSLWHWCYVKKEKGLVDTATKEKLRNTSQGAHVPGSGVMADVRRKLIAGVGNDAAQKSRPNSLRNWWGGVGCNNIRWTWKPGYSEFRLGIFQHVFDAVYPLMFCLVWNGLFRFFCFQFITLPSISGKMLRCTYWTQNLFVVFGAKVLVQAPEVHKN